MKIWEAALMADVLIVLNTEIMSLTMLKEMTAPRRMDARVTDVLLELQLNKSVMEIVDAGMAIDALMMMNRLTQKMSGSQKKSTQVMRNMMEMAETLEAVKTEKKTLTREKKSTQVMYKLMTVPKDSFVLPFRTDFIS